jgi:hypothetical protein
MEILGRRAIVQYSILILNLLSFLICTQIFFEIISIRTSCYEIDWDLILLGLNALVGLSSLVLILRSIKPPSSDIHKLNIPKSMVFDKLYFFFNTLMAAAIIGIAIYLDSFSCNQLQISSISIMATQSLIISIISLILIILRTKLMKSQLMGYSTIKNNKNQTKYPSFFIKLSNLLRKKNLKKTSSSESTTLPTFWYENRKEWWH